MKPGIRHITLLLLIAICSGYAHIQDNIFQKLIRDLQEYTQRNYQEKVYLQTDTDVYYSGDVLWFSTLLLDGQAHTSSKLSKVVHVKLYDSRKQELYHSKIEVIQGKGNGDILLIDTLPTGTYHLIGYTEWMKNFSPEHFFHQEFYVVNKPLPTSLYEEQPEEEVAIDFFPEGGALIQSIPNSVAFKTLNNKGIGVDMKGYLVNDRQDTILSVSTYKYGMGSFLFTPKSKRTYYFHTSHNGVAKKYPLPKAQEEGLNLIIKNDPDKVRVRLTVSKGLRKRTSRLILFAHCRGKVNFAAEGNSAAEVSEVDIPKERLSPGINHLTIFNEDAQPLAERLIFIPPKPAKPLEIAGLMQHYKRKELVEIQLNSRVSEDMNVSVSVHDRPDMDTKNIQNYLLLTSDLKGHIEDPGFYFTHSDSALRAADNLMLTQGWRRFSWQDVLSSHQEALPYRAESEGLILRGKLINKQTGKAVTDTLVILSVLESSPNFIFNKLSGTDEMLFAFYDMHGKYTTCVNLLQETAFHNNELISSETYDTLKFPFPSTSHSIPVHSLSQYLLWKEKEDLILSNYRLHKPELYSLPKSVAIQDEFFLNQLLSPNHELDPDQFIPLRNLKEMIFELIPSAKVKSKKGIDKVYVLAIEPLLEKSPEDFNKEPATIFLNGVPVFDHDLAFNQPYENIDKIEVFTGQYVIDDYTFHGFFSVTTKDMNTSESIIANASNCIDFEGLSYKREFYSPKYTADNSAEKRMPDLRHLLHWEPDVTIEKDGKATVTFYTSDVLNDFYINIEGITNSGIPIHIQEKFTTTPEL